MDSMVTRVLHRVFKAKSYSANPAHVTSMFKILNNALHYLAAGVEAGEDLAQGQMFQAYSMAIDAYRTIVYYLRANLAEPLVEAKMHNLQAMSRHPFTPGEVVHHNSPKMFLRALAETYLLERAFDYVKAQAASGTSGEAATG